MAVNKNPKISPVRVPVSNVNQFIRVPGYPPTALAQALQNWGGVSTHEYRVSDKETPQEFRTVREILFTTDQGEFSIPVTEQVYEVALYTRASFRFANWMRAHRGETINA